MCLHCICLLQMIISCSYLMRSRCGDNEAFPVGMVELYIPLYSTGPIRCSSTAFKLETTQLLWPRWPWDPNGFWFSRWLGMEFNSYSNFLQIVCCSCYIWFCGKCRFGYLRCCLERFQKALLLHLNTNLMLMTVQKTANTWGWLTLFCSLQSSMQDS